MKNTRLKLRIKRIITEVLNTDLDVEQHRCVNGDIVGIDTSTCIEDLEFRIEDAAADRDACNTRTDARVHYNGLLKVLRRKLRQSKKSQPDLSTELY